MGQKKTKTVEKARMSEGEADGTKPGQGQKKVKTKIQRDPRRTEQRMRRLMESNQDAQHNPEQNNVN